MPGLNVLSVCDGYSGARVGLELAGIKVNKYYASEIDKYPIQIAQKNYPDTIQLGDMNNWRDWEIDWETIDLVVGGTPCQGFSFSGKQAAFDDPRSKLFFVFSDIANYAKSINWSCKVLLENVKMKDQFTNVISQYMKVKPELIDSALVTAQTRKRNYWANWDFGQPDDLGIVWGDVREHGIPFSSEYYSEAALEWLGRHGTRKGKQLRTFEDWQKFECLTASHHKKYSAQRFWGIEDSPGAIRQRPATIVGRKLNSDGKREDYNKDLKTTQTLEVRSGDKICCLTTVRKDTVVSPLPIGRYPDVFKVLQKDFHYRYITALECERLQGLPDGFTEGVSNTQRLRMLGNGFNAPTLAHIFRSMNA